ncbi:hypothetical protein LCGC14_2197790, partial [marine sediment metagenome]
AINMAGIITTPLDQDFHLEVAKGNVYGHRSINKFGRNIDIDNNAVADIWDGGHSGDESLIWVAPTQARPHTIASDSGSDTSGGVGLRTLRVYGLTSWTSKEVTEDVTMDTGSPPVTTFSYVIIYRMHGLTWGATNVNVGTVTATAVTDGTVTAKIRPSMGQTQMAIFGIPSTQTAYVGRPYANVNKAGGATGEVDVSLLYNPIPETQLTNFLTRHTFGLLTAGTSAFLIPYWVPKVFEGPGILKIQVTSGKDNMDVSAGFDFMLVDN